MKNRNHRLLLLIAGSTQKELAAQVRYLKVQNEVLDSKSGSIDRQAFPDADRKRLLDRA